MSDICGDNRFEIIAKAKEDILKCTNISSREDEMKVIDNFLFRCWQMRWLDRYNSVQQTDKNSKNVWHDASEMPKENYKNIIYQTNYYSIHNVHITFIPTCLRSCKITSRSWDEFVKEVNMKKWAYIDDLLLKGNNK